MPVETSNEAQLVLGCGAALAVRPNERRSQYRWWISELASRSRLSDRSCRGSAPMPALQPYWSQAWSRCSSLALCSSVSRIPGRPRTGRYPNRRPPRSASKWFQYPLSRRRPRASSKRLAQAAPAPLPPIATPPPVAAVTAPQTPVTAEPLAAPETPAAPERPSPKCRRRQCPKPAQAPVTEVPQASSPRSPLRSRTCRRPLRSHTCRRKPNICRTRARLHLPGAAPVLAAEAPAVETTPSVAPPTQAASSRGVDRAALRPLAVTSSRRTDRSVGSSCRRRCRARRRPCC